MKHYIMYGLLTLMESRSPKRCLSVCLIWHTLSAILKWYEFCMEIVKMKRLMLTLMVMLPLNSWSDAQQDNYKKAQDKALEALYVQSGYKKDVDEFQRELEQYAKKLDSRYIPDYLHTPGGVLLFIIKAAKEQKLTCEWRF